MRTIVIATLSVFPWCGDEEPAPIDTARPTAACDLASEFQGCPECYSGEVECTFRDISVTEGSCGDCQARSGLYRELCESGVGASRLAIESETVCVTLSSP